MRPTFLRKRKAPQVPDPGQRVRLCTAPRRWLAIFRAISYPYTDEAGEVMIQVGKVAEYRTALRDGRPAISMPWPAEQLEVVLPTEDTDEGTQELPQRSGEEAERAEPGPATGGPQEGSARVSWWRTVFGV